MFIIEEAVYKEIYKTLTIPEQGGILGCDENGKVISFFPDVTGKTTKKYYIPNVNKLNEVIKEWSENGINFAGFVHTHRKGRGQLSSIDVDYAKKIKHSCNMEEILMLIYMPEDNSFKKFVL